jgi:cell division protein FtsL
MEKDSPGHLPKDLAITFIIIFLIVYLLACAIAVIWLDVLIGILHEYTKY